MLASYHVNKHPDVDLSIVVINWMSLAFLRGCLASIYANAGTVDFEVVVIDNASYDGCAEMLETEYPQVIFLQSDHNLGFAGANNLAFAHSRGRHVLFLNPDTEIQGDAIQLLLSNLKELPDAGMVGAHLLNSDLTLQTTCVTALPSILNQTLNFSYLRRLFPKWRLWGMKPLFDEPGAPVPVEAISGACMMAKRSVVEHVGVFSTEYFMYSEDMDLCARLAKCNRRIYYIPTARIVHHAGKSSSSRKENHFGSVMLRASVTRFLQLHRGGTYATFYRLAQALVSACRLLLIALALPITLRSERRRLLVHAFGKWLNVFAWSIGRAKWVERQNVNTAPGT